MMITQKILEKSSGLFGPISVGKSFLPSSYWMKIKDEIEGQVFADHEGNPGAIAASRYLYGFILPAWHFPASHGLMLGLGAGIGATMLLTLFPDLHLTVVEIDADIIRLTRAYFPFVSFYEKQNRLRIIHADASDYVNTTQNKFAFALMDVFSGDENSYHNIILLENVRAISSYYMANIIATEVLLPDISEDAIWIRTSPDLPTQRSNWMLTNMKNFSPEIAGFQLFERHHQEKNSIKIANRYFQYILSQIKATCFYYM